MSLKDELIDLLNNAHMCVKAQEKSAMLKSIGEIVFHRDQTLLPLAMASMVEFQTDKHALIQKVLLKFLENAVNIDATYLDQLFGTINTYISLDASDCSIASYKKSMLLATRMARCALKALISPPSNSLLLQQTEKQQQIFDSLGACIDTVLHQIDQDLDQPIMTDDSPGQRVNRMLFGIKFLEWLALTCSEASDHLYRDPARSNVSPDDLTLDSIPSSHRVLTFTTVLDRGERIIRKLSDRLMALANTTEKTLSPDNRKLGCVLVNSLCLVASLRPGLVNIIIPMLLQFEEYTRKENRFPVVRMTLRGNLLKLLRLATIRHQGSSIAATLEHMDAADQARNAISKAREPRRKYVATPLYAVRGVMGKRAAEKLRHSGSKRPRHSYDPSRGPASVGDPNVPFVITADTIQQMQMNDLVELVVLSMRNLPPRKHQSALKLPQLLSRVANPAQDPSATDMASVLSKKDQENVISRMKPSKKSKSTDSTTTVGSRRLSDKKQVFKPSVLSVNAESVIQIEKLKPMSPAMCKKMAELAVLRILKNERGARICGQTHLREKLLARLASNRWLLAPESDSKLPKLYEDILEYIFQNYQDRYPIGISLMYQEYAQETLETYAPVSSEKPQLYDDFANAFLSRIVEQMDSSAPADRALFRQILVQYPRLTINNLKTVGSLFKKPQGIVLGITSLRDLITDRQVASEAALFTLLHYTTHADSKCRNPSIRCVANQLYSRPELSVFIETYAKLRLQQLQNTGDPESEAGPQETLQTIRKHVAAEKSLEKTDMDTSTKQQLLQVAPKVAEALTRINDEETQNEQQLMLYAVELNQEKESEEEQDPERNFVLRRLELYIALCAKKVGLVRHLVQAYADCNEYARNTMLLSVEKLILHLKQKDGEEAVINEMYDYPVKAIGFVCHVIEILCQHNKPSTTLVDAVFALYNHTLEERKSVDAMEVEKPEDSRHEVVSLVVPVLPGISDSLLQTILHPLLDLPSEQMEFAWLKLFQLTPPSVEPSRLLLHLHHIQDVETNAKIRKQVIEAINCCFGKLLPVFTADVCLEVLEQLLDEAQIPHLTFRTMILSVTKHPTLKSKVLPLLKQLIHVKIWQNSNRSLYTGFCKCICLLQPSSFAIVYQLPLEQVIQLLEVDEPDLKPAFLAHSQSSRDIYDAIPEALRQHFQLEAPEVVLVEEPHDQNGDQEEERKDQQSDEMEQEQN